MSYHRRSYQGGTVKVSLSWSSMIGAYELKFDNAYGDWNKVKAVIAWIKMTIPSNERDYDSDTYVWTIHEKYFVMLRDVIQAVHEFNFSVFEKPEGSSQVKFVSLDEYTKLFHYVTNQKIEDLEFKEAQRAYRLAAMRMHPDRHPEDSTAGAKMSEFNEAWDIIKERYYKIMRSMEQVQ
jgi:hypothetical protein